MSSDAVKLFRMLREGFKLKICNLFAVTQNRQMNEPAPMENRLRTLQKIVLRLEMKGDKCKKIALQSGAKIEGIESLSINMEDCTLTVIGEADPGFVEKTLRRKFRCVEIVSEEPMSLEFLVLDRSLRRNNSLRKMVKKIVLRLEMKGDKCKKIALQSGAKIEGIDSLSINMEDCTLTVIGEADPEFVAKTLRRKFRCVEIVSEEPMSSLPQEDKPPTAALPQEEKPPTAALPPEKKPPWPRRRWPCRRWLCRRRPPSWECAHSAPLWECAHSAPLPELPGLKPEPEGGKDDGSASSEEKTIVKVEKDGPK